MTQTQKTATMTKEQAAATVGRYNAELNHNLRKAVHEETLPDTLFYCRNITKLLYEKAEALYEETECTDYVKSELYKIIGGIFCIENMLDNACKDLDI